MNEKTTPIVNLRIIYSNYGYITYPFNNLIFFKIGKITYEVYEDESYQYIIEPFFDVLEGLSGVEGNDVCIPGINLKYKLDKYYRVNMLPVFISDRTFPPDRPNKEELLKEKGMTYYDRLLWLLDSPYQSSSDKLLLKSDNFYDSINIKVITNISKVINELQLLGSRKDYKKGVLEVNSNNRGILIKTLLDIYKDTISKMNVKRRDNPGRKRLSISNEVFIEVYKRFKNKEIAIDIALSLLGHISKATFYRRIKEIESNKES
jgi:hypothetical protein